MNSKARFPTYLLGLFILGVVLMLSGAGRPPPFDRVQTVLSGSLHQPIMYAGVGLTGLAGGGLSLLVAVNVLSFLFRVATRGSGAVSTLPEIDPLIGGMMAFAFFGAIFLSGGMLAVDGPTEAGADLPFVSEAFDGSETSVHGVVTGDEFAASSSTVDSLPDYADSDGDRLPNAWERANETPGGTPLPGADPDHKDLYLQINYGTGIEPLNATEKDQLRRIWAGMPVRNPDGTTGVRVHLDDTSPRGGRMDHAVAIDGPFEREFLERYYDEAYLGTPECTPYLALVGRVTNRYDGYGMSPGYLSVVDGTGREPREGYSTRIITLTHEVLHNVVGEMETGQTHVRKGWLHGEDGEFEPSMSPQAEKALNQRGFSRSPFMEQHLCKTPIGSEE